jgi:competence protein ComEC
LSAVGLTHIVAVSGYNLTILVNVVHRIGGKKSKYRSLLFSLGLIAAFITITGVSASIARAALVSGLGLIAWYYGREIRPLLLIVLSAAITALINPLYLWSDIGWYLSFLAFFGILLLAPLISKRIFKAKEPNFLWSLLIETIAAQTMTLPLILYIFGRLSVLALVANALVVPFIPIAMVLSLIAGLAGIFLPMFAGWLVWPAKWLLMYMIDIATTISRFPHALVAVQLSWVQLVICYGFIIGVLLVLWHRQPAKNPAVVV